MKFLNANIASYDLAIATTQVLPQQSCRSFAFRATSCKFLSVKPTSNQKNNDLELVEVIARYDTSKHVCPTEQMLTEVGYFKPMLTSTSGFILLGFYD